MYWYSRYFWSVNSRRIIWGLGLSLLLLLTPQGFAQEEDLFGGADDSLLFGSEFDLGTEDVPLDLDTDGAGESTPAAEDDFFGEFDEEETPVEETETPAPTDDWGFGDDLAAEDSLAGDSTEVEFTDHPLDFRKSTNGTMLEGTGFTLSLYSPQVVNEKLDTWYSFLDFSLSVELPWHYEMDPFTVAFLVDISSFNFENSFPVGGTFKGFTIMPTVQAQVMGLEAEAGLGVYYPTWGIMTGLGYSIRYHSLYLSAGYRWNWAYKIEQVGSGWWLEPRITMGVKLW